MTRAVFEIEQHLQMSPALGEPVSEGLYKMTVHSVSLYYEIDDAKSLVRVTGVALIHDAQ